MIKFKVLRPTGQPTLQMECECGKLNVRAYTACLDLRPFICWDCLNALPNIMSLYKNKAYRVDYHIDGTMPPLFHMGLY